MIENTALVWFRRDLRLADNPALHAAVANGLPVIALYVLEDDAVRPPGGAARWWLHGSLQALQDSLARLGIPLILRRGAAAGVVAATARQFRAARIYWNRRYAAADRAVDTALKQQLTADGRVVESFNGNLLFEPWELKTAGSGFFKVFTPFWRAALKTGISSTLLPAPRTINRATAAPAGERLEDWQLRPSRPDWANGLAACWAPGEAQALRRLDAFVSTDLPGYADARDRPDMEQTSRLSPHLAFGEIGPRQIWQAARYAEGSSERDIDKFLSELGWREFSHHLLFHAPALDKHNFNTRFDAFPWRSDEGALRAWQNGLTGYPIVDAGMRQLWTTGWMHNRVRMIVASFLVKHLLIDWREGERWFWDTLVDADGANNAASWQWVAGCGADAAPYFRIFNPMLQGEKFDPDGAYVQRYVPELRQLPAKFIHAPWKAPRGMLEAAGVAFGETYPAPVVDHAMARARALKAFDTIKDR